MSQKAIKKKTKDSCKHAIKIPVEPLQKKGQIPEKSFPLNKFIALPNGLRPKSSQNSVDDQLKKNTPVKAVVKPSGTSVIDRRAQVYMVEKPEAFNTLSSELYTTTNHNLHNHTLVHTPHTVLTLTSSEKPYATSTPRADRRVDSNYVSQASTPNSSISSRDSNRSRQRIYRKRSQSVSPTYNRRGLQDTDYVIKQWSENDHIPGLNSRSLHESGVESLSISSENWSCAKLTRNSNGVKHTVYRSNSVNSGHSVDSIKTHSVGSSPFISELEFTDVCKVNPTFHDNNAQLNNWDFVRSNTFNDESLVSDSRLYQTDWEYIPNLKCRRRVESLTSQDFITSNKLLRSWSDFNLYKSNMEERSRKMSQSSDRSYAVNGAPNSGIVISTPGGERVFVRDIHGGIPNNSHEFYTVGRKQGTLMQSKMKFSSMPTLFDSKGDKKLMKLLKKQEKEEKKRREKEEKKRAKEEKKRLKMEKKLKTKTLPKNFAYTNGHVLSPGMESVYRRPMLSLSAVPIDIEDDQRSVKSVTPAPRVAPPPPPGPSQKTMSLYASAPDLLRLESVYGATIRGSHKQQQRPALTSDYGPRTVVLQRASEGYGFVLRGAKSQLKPSGELDFRPTPEFPALQYLDSVDPGSVSDRAGLKAGDFILEINGENVVRASHDRVVHLIRSTGDTLAMKVVTVRPAHRSQDWFIQADKSMTMPNRKKQAPAPPQRDPRTSLSMSRSEGLNISEEMAVMEKLDQAILGKKEEEKKTASIRNRTAAKRVSCVDINDIGAESKLERSKSTPDLLDSDSKQKRNIIYASPTVPGQKSSDERTVSSESGGVSLYARPSGPPPLPPQETASPKKKAPKPPGSDSGESTTQMVTINKQSPYASAKILVKADSTDSAYESSFRPGASAKLSEEPNEKSGYKPSHQRVSSEGAVIIRAGDMDSNKQNVSFAEDKVLDHAASFLKKHPNAKLLITAQGKESLRRRSSKRHPQEPEPDYDSDSGGDKPPSPVKMRDPKHQSVTVITVGDKRETQQQTQAKRYTIHSSIPSEEFVIPPRPEGPAPTPPKNTAVVKTQQSPTPSHSRILTVHAEVNTIHKHTHVEDHAPPLPETSPPRLEPVTAAPPPVAPAPPPPPPPPPPAPSVEEITRSKSVVKADYIAPVSVPADAIAAAVAKRQERLQNQGPKISTQTPKSPAPVMDTNQAAILAAVARRREQLEQQSAHSVVETIESRLQKTKKLQAAKFSLAGSKPVKKDVDVTADEKINSVSENKLAEAKKGIVKPSVPVKVTENPSKQENGVKAKELNFTVKSGNDHKKPVGGNEMRPKSPNTNKEFTVHKGAKLDRKESLQIKPLPLEPTVGHATMSNEQSGENKPKAHHTDNTNIQKNTEQENNKKNLNGQSDFLALAEKRRQEWLQRKQKTSDSKSSSNTASPEHIRAKDKTPSVATKPKTSNIISQGNSTASMNGNINNNHIPHAPPPPPGFRDDTNMGGKQVQLEIIPPPANFSIDSGMESSNQHSPAFSPDTASLVSSLSTLSSLSGDQNDGRGNGYDDVLAPPPPGFEDGDIPVIPPPPEFGNQHDSVTQWKNSKTFADKPVGQWLCNDVLDWLDSLSMSQYKSSFQRNCIDGKKLLALTRNNYIELGVTQVGHRMNIERSIKKAAIKQNNESNDVIASEHL